MNPATTQALSTQRMAESLDRAAAQRRVRAARAITRPARARRARRPLRRPAVA